MGTRWNHIQTIEMMDTMCKVLVEAEKAMCVHDGSKRFLFKRDPKQN